MQRCGKHIESMTILSVAYSTGGTKALPAHRSILGLVTPIFSLSSGLRCGERACQCNASKKDKSPGEGAELTIIVFCLAFTSPHKPCRTTSNLVQARTSNPVQVRTSNVKSKVDHSIHSSKCEYLCSCHHHNINCSNLQCMKQQHTCCNPKEVNVSVSDCAWDCGLGRGSKCCAMYCKHRC